MNKVYFSPGPDALNALLKNLSSCEETLDICMYTFSDNRISDVLLQLKDEGVKIRIITDNNKRFDQGSDIPFLIEQGFDVKADAVDAHMHHKFAIIDNTVTVTGSYNWTRSAEEVNNENILITDESDITVAYKKEFDKLWKKFQKLTK